MRRVESAARDTLETKQEPELAECYMVERYSKQEKEGPKTAASYSSGTKGG